MPKRKGNAATSPSMNTRAQRLIKKEPDEHLLNVTVKMEDNTLNTPRRNPSRGVKRLKLEEPNGHGSGSAVKREPSPATDVPQGSEDESDSQVSPRAVRRRPLAVTRSESEVAEDPEDPQTPRPKRLHRGSKSNEGLDSDADSADVDDLDLSPAPSASKPTPKELKLAALRRYTETRNTKPSPTSARKNVVEQAEASTRMRRTNSKSSPTSPHRAETSSVPDSEEEAETTAGTVTEEDLDKSDVNLIDDADQTADAARDVEDALGPELYARRNIEEQLAVFVGYIVRLQYEPDLLSSAATTDNDKQSYQAAITALRKHMDGYANSMLLSTWSGPFTEMLQRRPVLIGPISCDPANSDCQACWTRGPHACNLSGSCTLTTRKGFYDRDGDTFQDIPERSTEYNKETTHDFPNSANAPKLLYPPGFRLLVGARCSKRAVAYHQARHYMYTISTRVRDEIQNLCDQKAILVGDIDALVQALVKEGFMQELWSDFQADQSHWRVFQYRTGDVRFIAGTESDLT